MATVLQKTFHEQGGGIAARDAAVAFFREFLQGWECPLVQKVVALDNIDLIINGDTVISFRTVYVGIDIYINDVYYSNAVYWGNGYILYLAYSDKFFYFRQLITSGGGYGSSPLNFLFEIIDSYILEGYGQKNSIYDYLIYDKQTLIPYSHVKLLSYINADEDGVRTVDYMDDYLEINNGVTPIKDTNFISTSNLEKSMVYVINGNEYYALESNLLVPMFDPEPEPEPNPEENPD